MAHGRPKHVKEVLAEIMARRGYARVQSTADLDEAWRAAAGDLLAQHTALGSLRRGALEVLVAHSTLVQEITFHKAEILARLAQLAPQAAVSELRLRVGSLE
jgi:hypothetical protein